MLIDSHAHLTDECYDNVSDIIDNFNNNNLSHTFTIGCDLKSSQQCVELAQQHKEVYAIIGVHPSDILTLDNNTLKELKQLAKHDKVLAIGEIGLDYHYTTDYKQQQIDGLIAQLKLAYELQLPVMFHVRDSLQDMFSLLRQHKHLLAYGGVFHCFSYDLEAYKTITEEFGFYVSLGGSLTFKNNKQLQEVVKHMDLNYIILETDSPYLTPVPHRGKFPNEPKHVNHVAQKLAELKNISLTTVENTTNNNIQTLFKKFKI